MVLGALIILLVVVIAIGFSFTALSDFFSDFRSDAADKQDQEKNDVKPKTGQDVCDLLITVSGTVKDVFESGVIVQEFNYKISGDTVSYNWRSCHKAGTFSLASFLPGFYSEKLQELDFVAIGKIEHDIELTFQSLDGKKRGPDLDPSLKKTILLGENVIVSTPFSWSKTFLVEDLPREKYNVDIIVVGQSINDRPVNFPYIYNVLP